jgi:L-malate glycosyltransferase
MGIQDIPAFPLTSFYDRNAAKQIREFVKLLQTESIDIVQTHDFYTNVFGMFGAALARTPVRVAARRETTGVRTRSQSKAEKLAYQMAHAIVANADAVKSSLIKEGIKREKIVTIHNGLNLSRIALTSSVNRSNILAQFRLPEGYKFVTIVANLRHPVKDHGTFLQAAQQVAQTVPNVGFILAGEGELTGPMQQLAGELGITNQTFFLGRCERVNELLAISDVCVLSSVAEGFSNSILEYMGAGKPVVATDVGGAREAIREGYTGFLVAPKDFEAMAARLVDLLTDGNAAEAMGQAGRRVIEEEFSCEAQLKKTEELYAHLLSHGKAAVMRSQHLPSETL